MSSIVNKVKDALSSDKKHEQPEGTHGHHDSRVANAADPRVDSDHSKDHHNTHTTGGLTGNPAGAGHHTTGAHAGTHGTHTGTTGGLTGSNTVTGYDDPTGTHGTHNSRVANAADPRIDSDRDHRGAPGHTGVGAGVGSTGTHTGTHTTGTHTGAHTGAHTGVGHTGVGANTHSATTGPAPGTAGPHKSDFLNKADPRVDSDLDGSKTIGGNKTGTSGTTGHAKDPTDAAQVPPSVLAKHIGEPETAHGGVHGDHGRRNSIPSHQETHRGL